MNRFLFAAAIGFLFAATATADPPLLPPGLGNRCPRGQEKSGVPTPTVVNTLHHNAPDECGSVCPSPGAEHQSDVDHQCGLHHHSDDDAWHRRPGPDAGSNQARWHEQCGSRRHRRSRCDGWNDDWHTRDDDQHADDPTNGLDRPSSYASRVRSFAVANAGWPQGAASRRFLLLLHFARRTSVFSHFSQRESELHSPQRSGSGS